MSLLPKSIHRCRRYPTKFNSGRDIPLLPRSIHRCRRYPTKFNSGRDIPIIDLSAVMRRRERMYLNGSINKTGPSICSMSRFQAIRLRLLLEAVSQVHPIFAVFRLSGSMVSTSPSLKLNKYTGKHSDSFVIDV